MRKTEPSPPRPLGAGEPGETTQEELVQTLVAALEATYATGQEASAVAWATRLFRDLDEATLRSLVYRYGLFEEPVQADIDRRPGPPEERG